MIADIALSIEEQVNSECEEESIEPVTLSRRLVSLTDRIHVMVAAAMLGKRAGYLEQHERQS
ncbi:MAG: hypothetical protein ABSB96_10705 [Gaiellaceae bacterium]